MNNNLDLNKDNNIKAEQLYVLPRFERILNNAQFLKLNEEPTETDVDKPSNYNSIDGKDHQISISKYEMLTNIVTDTEPFNVWNNKGKKYIIDGRFDEYRLAVENNIEVHIIEHKLESISEARMFMMLYLLKKPQFNAAQRCIMVLQFEKDITKRAAKNRGRRSKMSDDSSDIFKKIITTMELAKLANVGEQYIKQFRRILKDGPEYFGKKETDEYISQIIREAASVNAINRKLRDKIEKEKEKYDFTNNNKDELFGSDVKTTTETESDVKTEGTAFDDTQTSIVYENPDYESNFRNKIVCGNNMDVLKKLPDDSVNLFFGSPDYNVPKIKYDISIPLTEHSEHIRKITEVAKECYRIGRKGSRMIINIAPSRPNEADRDNIFETFIVHDIVSSFEKNGIAWKPRNVIIWNKRYAFQVRPKGSPSAGNPFFTANHEYLIVFSKGTWNATPEMTEAPIDLTKNEYHKWGQTVWNIVPQSKGKGDHPCPFPHTLAEGVIRMFSFVGDTAVDPWMGSGTTTAVAAQLGRRWFGCDLSKKYCKHAAERTEKAHKDFLEKVEASQQTSKAA